MQDNLRSLSGQPISVRLLSDAHRLLLDGARRRHTAGRTAPFAKLDRRYPSWQRGVRASPAEHVPDLLADLERFIHDATSTLPPLVKTALVHAQFETVHPFLDGNGRIGRLLVAALLEYWDLLPEPLMYMSGFLRQHQMEYYRRLSIVRIDGDWESWVSFFLEGVYVAAAEAESSIIAVASLVAANRRRLLASPKAGPASYRLFE